MSSCSKKKPVLQAEIVTLILLFLIAAWRQASFGQTTDTAGTKRLPLPETELWLSRPSLFAPPQPHLELPPQDLPPEFLTNDFTRPPTFTAGFASRRADLISPLLLQWKSEERMRPFQIVLGSLSAGGAAYVAYRHIKKYGLFK